MSQTNVFKIRSSSDRSKSYTVEFKDGFWWCECMHFIMRLKKKQKELLEQQICKHIQNVLDKMYGEYRVAVRETIEIDEL